MGNGKGHIRLKSPPPAGDLEREPLATSEERHGKPFVPAEVFTARCDGLAPDRDPRLLNLRELQAALRLPLIYYRDGRMEQNFPERADRFAWPEGFARADVSTKIQKAEKLEDKRKWDELLRTLAPIQGQKGIQLLRAAFGERYIYLEPTKEEALLIGPLRLEEGEEELDLLVRRGLFPIQAREQAARALKKLPLLSRESAQAAGRLASTYLAQKRRRSDLPEEEREEGQSAQEARELEPPLATPLPPAYYRIYMQNKSGHFLHPPLAFEEEMLGHIAAGDTHAALSSLRLLNALTRATLADQPLRSLKNSLIASMTIFTRAAIRGGVPDDIAFTLSDAYIRQLEALSDLRSLLDFEEKAVEGFVLLVRQGVEQRYSRIVSQLLRYIDRHLSEELSVDQLAALLRLHPSYLSSLFRKETGVGLCAYIRRLRLSEAAHMILYSQDSLSSIADFYRFSSLSHFSRAFRAEYGLSPSQYASHRRQNRMHREISPP